MVAQGEAVVRGRRGSKGRRGQRVRRLRRSRGGFEGGPSHMLRVRSPEVTAEVGSIPWCT